MHNTDIKTSAMEQVTRERLDFDLRAFSFHL